MGKKQQQSKGRIKKKMDHNMHRQLMVEMWRH